MDLMTLKHNFRPGRMASSVLLASLLFCAPAVLAEDVPDPEQEGLSVTERLELLIERIKYEQAQLDTMEANFRTARAALSRRLSRPVFG